MPRRRRTASTTGTDWPRRARRSPRRQPSRASRSVGTGHPSSATRSAASVRPSGGRSPTSASRCSRSSSPPRLWRGVRQVRVVQPAAFFDLRLPERAAFPAVEATDDELASALRGRRFKVRRAVEAGVDGAPIRHLYGDRNQYLKMATLFTHLGLILFLIGGGVTGAFGYETVLFVGEGQTAPVQPVGTSGDLLVQNLGFRGPGRPG